MKRKRLNCLLYLDAFFLQIPMIDEPGAVRSTVETRGTGPKPVKYILFSDEIRFFGRAAYKRGLQRTSK